MFYYSIKPGDTFYKLGQMFNIPVSALMAANPEICPYELFVGRQILIPADFSITNQNDQVSMGISENELEVRNVLRALWEEHVAWTRMTITSAVSDSPDLDFVVKRLLRNSSDMAAALQPFYGDHAAEAFENLIHQHLTIALDLVKAAKAGDSEAAQNAERRWYANADQIVNFLGTINPYINREDFRNMFYTHLALTKAEAVEQLSHNYEKSIALYDQIEEQALAMADMLADAIIRQFPGIFHLEGS